MTFVVLLVKVCFLLCLKVKIVNCVLYIVESTCNNIRDQLVSGNKLPLRGSIR